MDFFESLSSKLSLELNWKTAVLCLVLPLPLIYLYGLNNKKKLPPGPFKWPLIGNTIDMVRENPYHAEYMTSLSKQYGPIVGLKMMNIHMIIINDYDMFKEAFVKMADKLGNRPNWMPIQAMLFKHGLSNSNGKGIKDIRKFILLGLRDFGMGKRSIEYKILEEAEALQKRFLQFGEDPWYPKEFLHNGVSNVVCNIIFGHRFEYSDAKFREMVDDSNFILGNITTGNPAFTSFFLARLSPLMKEMCKRMDGIYNLIDEEIENHRSTFDAEDIRDFIDLYLQQEDTESGHLSKDEIKGIIRDLFMAGTDTTSTTLCWSLLYMIAYPEIQQKCHDEIDTVVGNSRNVTMADKATLPYIEATIAEIHRHATIAAINAPHTSFEDVEFNGYHIPKKSFVLGNIYAIHRDTRHFGEDVEVFRPERFLGPDGSFVKNDHLIPFSIGSRACIGEQLARMEIFLFFTSFLQKFSFEKSHPSKQLDLQGITSVVRAPKEYKLVSKQR